MSSDPRERLYTELANVIRGQVQMRAFYVNQSTPFESPIEELAYEAMQGVFIAQGWNRLRVHPQHQEDNYRIDFLVTNEDETWKIAVECDGHEFHDRTKEQASRDRSRDRRLQAKGYRVMRFTGSDIWRDPVGMASEVLTAAVNLGCEAINREMERRGYTDGSDS